MKLRTYQLLESINKPGVIFLKYGMLRLKWGVPIAAILKRHLLP
jgi:hypothetical protein